MPRSLWNEGRVVGYSAYEMYVKHSLEANPDSEPASEKEWLASMMAFGSSMLLRIGADSPGEEYDGLHYRDVQFPDECKLCAANIILASFFDGEGYVSETVTDTLTAWATKVTSYGTLIQNNTSASPNGIVGNSGDIPPSDISDIKNSTVVSKIKEYMKVVDGIIIQPGTWVDNPNKPPQKDFTPTLSDHPRLRIAFSERIKEPFYLLLTGFTNRTVVDGVTGFSSAVNTMSPENGDFLGPWMFPWSAKVIFSVPSSFINYFVTNSFSRKIPLSGEEIDVNDSPLIDMRTTNPSDYYSTYDSASRIEMNVTKCNTPGNNISVIATYQNHDNLPPALYGSQVSEIGNTYLYPLDCVAPGTLKLIDGTSTTNKSLAHAIEEKNKNYAFLRNTADYTIHQISSPGTVIPVADVDSDSVSDDRPTYVVTTAGSKKKYSLSMADLYGEKYELSGNSDTIDIQLKYKNTEDYMSKYEGIFNWNTLVSMLHNNKSAKLKLEIKAVDPNNYIAVDITPVLSNRGSVSANFKFGNISKDMRLKVVSSEDTWDNLSSTYDGYFRMIIKLNTTEVGTTSKFEIACIALLKSSITFTDNTPGHRQDCGFYWRGTWGDNIYPIFGNTPVGTNCIEGSPVYVDSNFSIPSEILRSMTADTNDQNSWGLNLKFSAARVPGANPHVILIDRSYSYNDITYVNTCAGLKIDDSITSYTYKSSIGVALNPSNAERLLTSTEYEELKNSSACIRYCAGVYAV